MRPHCKTHKTLEITRLQLEAGVLKHKCATIAEAEMLAMADAPEVLIAYPLVGPNIHRFAKLIRKYPRTEFAAIADHPAMVQALSAVIGAYGLSVDVLVDVNAGHGGFTAWLARAVMAVFRGLFHFNLMGSPFGWQVVAVGRKTGRD